MRAVLALLTLLITGCASGYNQFYKPAPSWHLQGLGFSAS